MLKAADALRSVHHLDELASLDSPIHRLDPRTKVITTLIFAGILASFGQYEVSALLPFALYPVFLASAGSVPMAPVLRRVLLALPFVLLLGAFNPWLDRQPMLLMGRIHVGGGWVSYVSILLRFVLGASAALLLIATTGFFSVGRALERLGAPRAFAVQLLVLYRYLFVLGDEAARMERARSLRAFGRGMSLREFGSFAGNLFLRAWERAQRIHAAMLCRGFDGLFPVAHSSHFRFADWIFLLTWVVMLVLMRIFNVPFLLGNLAAGGSR